jgi:hypothetical protein
MKSCFFGLGVEFDDGDYPGVAINEGGTIVEVHKNEGGWKLYGRLGQVEQATVTWYDTGEDRDNYTDGSEPACAINNHGVIVEVHKREVGDVLFSTYGRVDGTSIDWADDSEEYDGDGKVPGVALNDNGRVLSVFQKNDDELRYRVGQVDTANEEIDWEDPHGFATGVRPRVAMNNSNYAIAVWNNESSSTMKYCVGAVGSDEITWGVVYDLPQTGYTPSVALTNDNFVVVVYKPLAVNLNQLTGRLDTGSKTIAWDLGGAALYYDDGKNPSVAAAGSMAITLHQGESLSRLWFATSIITDRANWMRDRLGSLGSRQLKDLILPASHDSGMYTAGLSIVAKTQELSILGQLENGIRYFDLRPKYDAGDDRFDIHHGGVEGPTLAAVLADIREFAASHSELIIIDFSHFEDFGSNSVSTVYDRFTSQISDALGLWMFMNKPADVRLSQLTLRDYALGSSRILVCIDDDFAIKYPKAGFWLFRNSLAANVAEGALRVFDQYASDMNYDDMRDDQLRKYENYAGYANPVIECDLFLLSWTCTSIVGAGVWQISKDPNRHLGRIMADLNIPNDHGQIPNLLYVDYCEFARVTDVALFANGAPYA